MIVHVFQSHQKSQYREILAQGIIRANLKHDEARFLNPPFLRILAAFFVFLDGDFRLFLTHRTKKLGHKDYFKSKKKIAQKTISGKF